METGRPISTAAHARAWRRYPTARPVRREQLFAHTQILTLREYLLLSQDQIRAELHRRDADGWTTLHFSEGAVPCACLGSEVPLEAIYENVPLTAPGAEAADTETGFYRD